MKRVYLFLLAVFILIVGVSCSSTPSKSGKEVGGNIFYIYSGAEDGTIEIHTNGVVLINNGEKQIRYTFFDAKGKRLETKHADIVGGINLKDDDFGLADAYYYKVSGSDKKDHFFVTGIDLGATKSVRGDKVIKRPDGRICWSFEAISNQEKLVGKSYCAFDEKCSDEDYVKDHSSYARYVPDAKNYTSRNIGTGRSNTELLMSIPEYQVNLTGVKVTAQHSTWPTYAETVWKILKEERAKDSSLNDWFVPSRFELEELVNYVGPDNWDGVVRVTDNTIGDDSSGSVVPYAGETVCWSSSAFTNGLYAYGWSSKIGKTAEFGSPRRDLSALNGNCFVLITAF